MKTKLLFVTFSLLSLAHLSDVFAHTPPSLQGVAVPATPNLLDGANPIVLDKKVAIQLGKALFWDTALSSDGMTACGTCHFHAGADSRTQNQLSTGALSKKQSGKTFQPTASGEQAGVNYRLKHSDFPFQQFANSSSKLSNLLFDSDDVVSSAGVFKRKFKNATAESNNDECNAVKDTIFHANDLNTRQVQRRQAPTVINAAFNFRNFWDGRANNIFNGSSPFGARDANAGVWVVQTDGSIIKEKLALENASLASQAVAPAVNDGEMACMQRTLPAVGRKLLTRKPLASQQVHEEDSVLAELRDSSGVGLNTTYETLIKASFAPRYWAGTGAFGKPKGINVVPYKQMEANFSLFLGLALQLYQETLISDQSPFDSPRLPNTFPAIPSALTTQQVRGLNVFLDAQCNLCHKGAAFTAASHPSVYGTLENTDSLRLIDRKTISGAVSGVGVAQAILDEGYFNTSVSLDERDIGLGGKDPLGNPLSFSEQYIQELLTGKKPIDPVAMNACDLNNSFILDYKDHELISDSYQTGNCYDRTRSAKIPTPDVLQKELTKNKRGRAYLAVKGAFKTPTLRNIELTGPYMHNGSLATLEQVVDFYFRGGNFDNPAHFTTLVFSRNFNDDDKADLVAFLKSLTDERVRWERAPFDHPSLRVPHGQELMSDMNNPLQAQDVFLDVPAVGKNGRGLAEGALLPFENYLAP